MLPRSHSSTDGGSTNPVWRSTSRKLLIPPLPWCTNQRAMPHYGLDRTKSDRLLGNAGYLISAVVVAAALYVVLCYDRLVRARNMLQ